jgi:hypothetical protein
MEGKIFFDIILRWIFVMAFLYVVNQLIEFIFPSKRENMENNDKKPLKKIKKSSKKVVKKITKKTDTAKKAVTNATNALTHHTKKMGGSENFRGATSLDMLGTKFTH